MGALSVVICAILSHFFLSEKLSFFGWLGCGLCIVRPPLLPLLPCAYRSTDRLRRYCPQRYVLLFIKSTSNTVWRVRIEPSHSADARTAVQI